MEIITHIIAALVGGVLVFIYHSWKLAKFKDLASDVVDKIEEAKTISVDAKKALLEEASIVWGKLKSKL